MSRNGLNMEYVKSKNRSKFLKLLNNNEVMSRMDVASTLSLTRATVTNICSNMIEKGIIIEKGEMKEKKRAGRKKILIEINYKYKHVLGINIEPDFTYISISDLKGEIVICKKIKTISGGKPKDFFEVVASHCTHIIQQANIPKEKILGVGISVVGPVDKKNGMSKKAYGIWDEEINVRDYFEQKLGYKVVIENNVKAFVIAQILYGLGKEVENFIVLKWGPGVGSDVIINGKLYEGESFNAAEVGHCIVQPDGKQCKCGKRGCLETVISFDNLVKMMKEIFSRDKTPGVYESCNGDLEHISEDNIINFMAYNDPGIIEMVDKVLDIFCLTVANLLSILAPSKIILYGRGFEERMIVDKFIVRCNHYNTVYNKKNILVSKFKNKMNYIGPISLVVNEMFFENGGI